MKYLLSLALFLGFSAQVMAYSFTIENCKNQTGQTVDFIYQLNSVTQYGKIYRDSISGVVYDQNSMVKLDGGLKGFDPILGKLFIYCDDSSEGCRLEAWSNMKWPCPKAPPS